MALGTALVPQPGPIPVAPALAVRKTPLGIVRKLFLQIAGILNQSIENVRREQRSVDEAPPFDRNNARDSDPPSQSMTGRLGVRRQQDQGSDQA